MLEASVGQETLAKAYFNGELDNLKQAVNRLGGSADTWNSLSANIDLYGRYSSLGDDISRIEAQKCEVEINRTLHSLYKKSKEIVYPYVARGNNQEGLR